MPKPKDNKINISNQEPESKSLGYQIELLKNLIKLADESQQVLKKIENFYSDKSLSDKIFIVQEVVKEFENNNDFKQQIINSVKSGSLRILKKGLEQPVLLLIIDELEALVNSELNNFEQDESLSKNISEVVTNNLKEENNNGSFSIPLVSSSEFKISLEKLPLFDIFNNLRQRHGFPLGIEEYLIVVKSLKAGFGINNRQELEQLCCTLWAKSEEESRLIHKLFEQMWIQIEDNILDEVETESKLIQTGIDFGTSFTNVTLSSELENKPIPEIEESPSIMLEQDEPVQVVKAIRTRHQETSLNRPCYSLLNEYFPVTKRQMKQSWRYLRRPVREGIAVELDIESTVDKIGREGLLIEPFLIPRRINKTDLILMVDQEGSMTPFHGLSRQLIETAQRGGKLRQTRVFYFHDYVDKYIYRHPALLNAQKLDEMLAEVGERAIILIISDGGAARGKFEEERIKQTQIWINQLQESVKYVAWLNPMPSDSWQYTTASEIAQMLPMFEMSREGMNNAISVLRGKNIIHNLKKC